eukprot:NODE_170_length_1293_cov_499.140652_g166_i0.p1 GENE.NODE_170_length_1293_cov_499.140652_g166_i0~~NODE_170_length_1293_cov_499.140652_g166_i0.p1  ORF type:complete len:356 (-),score=92.00 NODE_170_length_1293_cov_499.140652_g166_i0:149-1216(-)
MLPRGLTIYTTSLNAIRKEVDDCRRLRHIFDTHQIKYKEVDFSINKVISKNQITKKSMETGLPQVFIGDTFLGSFDTIEEWNENENMLMSKLQEAGYIPQSEEENRRFDEEMQEASDAIARLEIKEQKDINNPPPEPKFKFTSESSQKTFAELPEKTREILGKLDVTPNEHDVDLLRFITVKHYSKILDSLECGNSSESTYRNLILDLKVEKKRQFMKQMGIEADDVVDPLDTLANLKKESEEKDRKREESIQAAREAAATQHQAEVAALERQRKVEEHQKWEALAAKREQRRAAEEAARKREEELRAAHPPSDREKFQSMLAQQAAAQEEVEKQFKKYQEEFNLRKIQPDSTSG